MVKVTVLGAAGGIGQPLSLLLKLNNDVTHLSLYDIVNVPGVAADLSHINTKAKVTSHLGPANLPEAIKDSSVIIIPAGIPRKPGMTRDDLFRINASIVRDLAIAIAKHSPEAFVLVISNPVNSTVPIVSQVFKDLEVYNPKKIFGVTTLDSVRASAFANHFKQEINPFTTRLPIIGGHSGATIVPLFSHIIPQYTFTKFEIEELTKRVQYGGDEVVKAKGGAGSATLSMAHAGARFANAVIGAIAHNKSVVESAYVSLDSDSQSKRKAQVLIGNVEYFAFDIEINGGGVNKIIVPQNVTPFEQKLIDEAANELKGSISKGIDFAKVSKHSRL